MLPCAREKFPISPRPFSVVVCATRPYRNPSLSHSERAVFDTMLALLGGTLFLPLAVTYAIAVVVALVVLPRTAGSRR